MRFLVDNALCPALAALLRDAGHHAIHVREIGLQHAEDDIIFECAAADSCVFVAPASAEGGRPLKGPAEAGRYRNHEVQTPRGSNSDTRRIVRHLSSEVKNAHQQREILGVGNHVRLTS